MAVKMISKMNLRWTDNNGKKKTTINKQIKRIKLFLVSSFCIIMDLIQTLYIIVCFNVSNLNILPGAKISTKHRYIEIIFKKRSSQNLWYLASIWALRLFSRCCDICKDFRFDIPAIHRRYHKFSSDCDIVLWYHRKIRRLISVSNCRYLRSALCWNHQRFLTDREPLVYSSYW